MSAARDAYRRLHAGFAWNVPATFNFAADVVDRLAAAGAGPALIWEDANGRSETYSFADIAGHANRLANVLRDAGIRAGDRILVMLPRIPQWQIAMVAALKIGAVPIPCIEMLTARDVEYRVRNSGAKGVLCRAAETGKFAALTDLLPVRIALGGAPGWRDWEAETRAAPETCEAAVVQAEDPAIMFYTSGSTSHPKGVLHAARALYAWRGSAQHWLDLGPCDRIWCTADTGWSKAGTSILFGPWSRGACAFFYDGPFVPAERLRLLEKHAITVYCAAATELNRVVDENLAGRDLSRLRRIVSAGEAVNPAICERWRRATGLDVAEAYGLTEVLMLVLNIPGQPVKPGSMGLPAPGSVVDVIDAAGRRLPDETDGDIGVLMPNPQTMLGYWQDPERTAACFVEGPEGRWFVTGDRGRRDGEGHLWYAGRSDDVINSAGYRIGPLEVENALLEHAGVQECAVIGAPDPERGEIVKAFVVLRPDHAPSDALARALQDHVKALTAPYKYPRAIAFVAELPKTMTGKIRRSSLRQAEVEAARKAADGRAG